MVIDVNIGCIGMQKSTFLSNSKHLNVYNLMKQLIKTA